MDKLQELIQKVLRSHPEVKLCVVFGSIAAGKASADSDLDIGVAAAQPLSADEYLELIEEFSSKTNREIDLVDLTTASGPILKQALSTGIVMQNSDKSLYASLISRMLFNQADMMPYYDRILRERRSRFINE
jgi:predicted nucleotidyltransferase